MDSGSWRCKRMLLDHRDDVFQAAALILAALVLLAAFVRIIRFAHPNGFGVGEFADTVIGKFAAETRGFDAAER